jgi:hypothetical protein
MFAAAVLVLSACDSESRVQSRPAPRLPRTVATKLALRSDALAAALRRGDGCAAKIQMHGLERQTRLAISSGRIPTAFRARLLAAVADLSGRMPTCVPPPPPPPPVARQPPPRPGKDEKKAHGKHDRGKKGHGKGHET